MMMSILMRDDELFCRAGIDFRRFFQNLLHFRKARSPFERGAKFIELLGGSAGKSFHAAIVKIAHKSA